VLQSEIAVADRETTDPGEEEPTTDPGSAWAEKRREKKQAIPEWVTPRYRIIRQIGSGGFGVVYEAVDDRLQKRVAVKRLNKDDAENFARLRTEALATAKIHHRNIVGVTDFDALEDGTPFLVMEYAEGEDFRDLLERDSPFEVGRAVRVARTLLDALGAAHQHGIVHRDLKPGNIVIGDAARIEETLRICDFGLVKLLDTTHEGRLTQSGDFLGTPMYMAPEQVRQRDDVDGRADVYSVGAILYEMLVGSAPFAGRPVGDLLIAKVTEKPQAPSSLNRSVPRALDRVVLRAIQPEPKARYQSAQELSSALAPFVSGATPESPLKRISIAVGAVAAVALIGLLLWNQRGDRSAGAPPPPAAEEPSAPVRSGPLEPAPVDPQDSLSVIPDAGPTAAVPDAAPQVRKRGRRGDKKPRGRDAGSDLLFGP
jgi:serine/threonine protein kinase